MSTVKEAAKTKADIIQETLEYYSQDPSRRALDDDGGCYYLSPSGRRCAIGRCLSEKAKANVDINNYFNGVVKLANNFGKADIDNLLAPEYRGHDVDFWHSLQGLHDRPCNWTSRGLSRSGVETVEKICSDHDVEIKDIDFNKVNVDR